MKVIDLFDEKILNVIQQEGRIPVVDLASRISLSKSPCLQRLRRLERDGIIKEYRAILDSKKVGQSYLVFLQVKLESTTTDMLAQFNEAVKKVPGIQACHMVSGGFDYLLKVRTRDMESYRAMLGDAIANLPGVYQTSTFPVMEEVHDTSIMPIDSDADKSR